MQNRWFGDNFFHFSLLLSEMLLNTKHLFFKLCSILTEAHLLTIFCYTVIYGQNKDSKVSGNQKETKEEGIWCRTIKESEPTGGVESASSKKLALFDLETEWMIEKKQSIEEMVTRDAS